MSANQPFQVVHTSAPKVDGVDLVTGAAKYTDDFQMPGMVHAKILTSPHAHARIVQIDPSRAKALPGVQAVLTHLDLPKIRHTRAGQSYPEPSPYDHVILDDKVRFVGDRVAVVAAESLQIAEQALGLIDVEYEILPAVFDMEAAMQPGAPIIHDESDALRIYDASRNIAAHAEFECGDVKRAFQEAEVVIEQTFHTQRVKHCALETHVSLAYLDEHGRLVIISSTQVPFHTRRQLAHILNLPMTHIRVIKPRIGGGFGNKQAMCLEDLVAVLTLRTRRPVKLLYTREEEFIGGFSRHPQIITLKTGAKKDGTIIAHSMKVLGNTGAYGDHAPTVQECTGRKVLPLYRAPHVRFEFDAVYTNLPVSGAFRGYGAPQGFFALESQMDELAHRLNMDPLKLRQKNHIRAGDTDPVSLMLGDPEPRVILSCGLEECLERGAAAIGWTEKRGRFIHEPDKPENTCHCEESATKQSPETDEIASQSLAMTLPSTIRRGVGMACAMQGSGIAGVDWGSATIKLNDDGTFTLYVGATDLGTGADTILTQIAAEALGVGMNEVRIIASDTDLTPFDVGAYASSTTYISGHAVQKAAQQVSAEILKTTATMLGIEDLESVHYQAEEQSFGTPDGKTVMLRDVAAYIAWEEKRQICVTASHVSPTSPPPFIAQFVEVEVDTETGHIRVVKLVSAVDCGTTINPLLAEGQIEGAVTQGLGYALSEEMVFDAQGRLYNPNFADYKLLNAFDMPRLETIIVETYEPTGPYGAKSVAEVPINCPAPAVANAIFDAIGVRLTELPLTAEKILAALKKR